jgi:hypothetical protein
MSERTPITQDEVREGDVVEFERDTPAPVSGAFAMTVVAQHDRQWSAHFDRAFLLERPEPENDPARHLPAEPTLGWAVVDGKYYPGRWHLYRPRAAEAPMCLLQPEREIVAVDVDDFVEGVLVQKSALDALLLAHPPRPGALLEPVDHFLRVAVKDR